VSVCIKENLAHQKTHLPRTLPRPMPRVVGGAQGGGRFLMGEVPLQPSSGEGVAFDPERILGFYVCSTGVSRSQETATP